MIGKLQPWNTGDKNKEVCRRLWFHKHVNSVCVLTDRRRKPKFCTAALSQHKDHCHAHYNVLVSDILKPHLYLYNQTTWKLYSLYFTVIIKSLVKTLLRKVSRLLFFLVRVTWTSALVVKKFYSPLLHIYQAFMLTLPPTIIHSHTLLSPSFKAVFHMNQPFLFWQLWSVISILRGYNDFEWASIQSLDYAKPQLLRRLNIP